MPLVNGPGRFRGPGSCLAQNCICSFAGIINILESTAVGEVHTARSEEPGNLIGFAPSEGPMDQVESFRGVPGSGSVEGDDIPDEVLDERINELVAGWAGSLFGGQATRAPQDSPPHRATRYGKNSRCATVHAAIKRKGRRIPPRCE